MPDAEWIRYKPLPVVMPGSAPSAVKPESAVLHTNLTDSDQLFYLQSLLDYWDEESHEFYRRHPNDYTLDQLKHELCANCGIVREANNCMESHLWSLPGLDGKFCERCVGVVKQPDEALIQELEKLYHLDEDGEYCICGCSSGGVWSDDGPHPSCLFERLKRRLADA